MTPFLYPESPHVRRHGPAGYANYNEYRPWLRDEFTFRCVYCLKREQWGLARGTFHLDHFKAQVYDESGVLDYDNLLYACASCNLGKSAAEIPDPTRHLLDCNVVVHENGSIEGTTKEAKALIGKLGLDAPDYREFRTLWIGVLQLAAKCDPDLYRRLMRFPDDLPNLERLSPPEGNTRPGGISQTFWAQRERGELPDMY